MVVAPISLNVEAPEGAYFNGAVGTNTQFAISPNGRYLAFVALSAGITQIWVRPLASFDAYRLDGTQGARNPFWSPDSEAIGFFAEGKLKRIAVSGGAAVIVCDAVVPRGGAWSREGFIVFQSLEGPISKVPASGGEPVPISLLDTARKEISHTPLQFLPDGRILFSAASEDAPHGGIYAQSIGSSVRTLVLATNNIGALFVPPNRLLYVSNGTLLVQGLDAGLQLTGRPVPLAQRLLAGGAGATGARPFSVSDNGVLAYYSGLPGGNAQIYRYGRDGRRSDALMGAGTYLQIELSPDDRYLAVERITGSLTGVDLWLLELSRNVFSRLTSDPADERDPVWTSDARSLIFGNKPRGDIRQLTIGSPGEKVVYQDPKVIAVDDLSGDGRLVFHTDSERSVSSLPLGGKTASRLIKDAFAKDEVRISPDGRWVVYDSDQSGKWEVYVASFPSFTNRHQVSAGRGVQPRWRRDGRELFYLSSDGKMMALDVKAGSGLETGTPKALFQTTAEPNGTVHVYAVSGDGQTFYVRERIANSTAEQISVVVNWPAVLGR